MPHAKFMVSFGRCSIEGVRGATGGIARRFVFLPLSLATCIVAGVGSGGNSLISEAALNHLWSQYEGRVLVCNTVSQVEAGVLSEDFARRILREFDRCDLSVAQIWGLIQGRHDDPDDKLNLRFASDLAPPEDGVTRLIRVAPLGAIIANVDKAQSDEIKLIETELNSFKPRVDADPKNKVLLDACEEELHELFDTAADEQRRAGTAGFSHGDMSWVEVGFTTNIKLSSRATGIPTFCMTNSASHREAEIFSSRAGAADRARDVLGLAPFDNTYNDSVIAFGAMAFDPGDLEGTPAIARPSVADLVDDKRFTGVFGELDGVTDAWGRAFDLATVNNRRPHRGGREVVVAARRPERVHIAFLGYLRLLRRDVYTDPNCDARFEALCLRGRTKDDFMKMVCG